MPNQVYVQEPNISCATYSAASFPVSGMSQVFKAATAAQYALM
jgi:hypothetical protein